MANGVGVFAGADLKTVQYYLTKLDIAYCYLGIFRIFIPLVCNTGRYSDEHVRPSYFVSGTELENRSIF